MMIFQKAQKLKSQLEDRQISVCFKKMETATQFPTLHCPLVLKDFFKVLPLKFE
jgi:hypothetical protein